VAKAHADTSHAVIFVGDLDDSDKGVCRLQYPDEGVVEADPHVVNECTLRSAIILANQYSVSRPFTILIRQGLITLHSTLPEVQGTLQIRGSALVDNSNDQSLVQQSCDADDDRDEECPDIDASVDPGFDPQKAAAGAAGQKTPIGTVLDGGGFVQILRSSVDSALHLHTLRFEDGHATGEEGPDDGDARASWGGGLNALGMLVLTNVAFRGCLAEHGGAVYSQSEFEAHFSLFEHNVARSCGGAAYLANGGHAHFAFCDFQFCMDSCGRQMVGTQSTSAGRYGGAAAALGGPSAQGLLPGAGAGQVASQRRGKSAGAKHLDVSGAIAEGPPLDRRAQRNRRAARSRGELPDSDTHPERRKGGVDPERLPRHADLERHKWERQKQRELR